jgi:hypothetical protein
MIMGMKEPPGRKGNEASKGFRETDKTRKNLEDEKRSHPRRGALAADEKPRLERGNDPGSK